MMNFTVCKSYLNKQKGDLSEKRVRGIVMGGGGGGAGRWVLVLASRPHSKN